MGEFLTTGGAADPFLPRLLAAIRQANQVDLAVAFIRNSGLGLVFPTLVDAVTTRGARLRVLTSDYLDVTEPDALRQLLLLGERGADVRVFATEDQSFHLKAYICARRDQGETLWGAAFVGSSNLSRTALTDGLEWNLRADYGIDPGDPDILRFREIQNHYQALFEHSRVAPLTHTWIEAYEQRRQTVRRLPVVPERDEPEELPPEPTAIQAEALAALAASRAAGYRRALVVLATGLGKTFLAAFDSRDLGARRVLFVAHREEILLQAEASFLRTRGGARVGRYTGARRDEDVDLLFASVQTLGQNRHLERFPPDHFDYLVVDEFHHAAAPTYRRLLRHFRPRFLLGLTATPERTDQSDILSLCDDNLVYSRHLFDGIRSGLLCPFHYYGICDETVDYQEIPWRNGRFDPHALGNRLATVKRARHALRHWRERGQRRTLAFCVSQRHADFMAERFQREGVRVAAVHQRSSITRGEALERLARGDLQVIFSVDLFNEGVDLPAIDTVMMLRPTESKVIFLQQLGRGLRRHGDKERLVVLDFIGNHRGFLNKPQALFGVGGGNRHLAAFARRARDGELDLPPGCFVDYDLAIIDFLTRLDGTSPGGAYRTLADSLGRRPTLTEFYRSGASLATMRRAHGQWWELVRAQGDLEAPEEACLERHGPFLRYVETTAMARCFKAVLLESLLDTDGSRHPPRVEDLATQALEVFRRRRAFVVDIHPDYRDIDGVEPQHWLNYWSRHPINALIGGNLRAGAPSWFEMRDGRLHPRFTVAEAERDTFHALVQELVDYRLAAYAPRLLQADTPAPAPPSSRVARVVPFPPERTPDPGDVEVPCFPDLGIACGHFRDGRTDAVETFRVPPGHGNIDPAFHFVARAVGDSMDGGRRPVRDGDYLLLERLDPVHAGSITGTVMAIERQGRGGDDQYLLRKVTKRPDGGYVLKAANPAYPDLEANEDLRTLARLVAVLSIGD